MRSNLCEKNEHICKGPICFPESLSLPNTLKTNLEFRSSEDVWSNMFVDANRSVCCNTHDHAGIQFQKGASSAQ